MAETQNLQKEQEINELKKEIQNQQVVVGSERVLKLLQGKGLKKIYLAKNCPAKLHQDVEQRAKLAGVPLIELPQTNEELGVLCKKNFFVSVLGTRGV